MPQIFEAMLLGSWMSKNGGKQMRFMGVAKTNHKDLVTLGELLEAGKIVPVIDARYPLSKTAEAIRYVEEKHPQGKVIITMEPR